MIIIFNKDSLKKAIIFSSGMMFNLDEIEKIRSAKN